MALRRVAILASLLAMVYALRGPQPGPDGGPGATAFLLGFVLLTGYLSGLVATDLGLPRITGYLVGGLALGPSLLGLVSEGEIAALSLIDDIAIALIAFSAGAELRLQDVRDQGRSIGAVLLVEMSAVFLVVGGAVFLLKGFLPLTAGLPWVEVAVLAALIGTVSITNSPSVAVAVINETRARGPVTSLILGVTLAKDVAVIIVLALVISVGQSVLTQGAQEGPGLAAQLGWEIGGSLALGVTTGWLVHLYLDRWRAEPVLFILGVAAVLAYLSRVLHLEVLLASVATGLFVENYGPARAEPFVEAVRANSLPFYAIFFALAGAGMQLDYLASAWPLVMGLVAIRAGAVYAGTRLGTRIGGATPAATRYAWMGFLPQAGVTLGLITIAGGAFPQWGAGLRSLLIGMLGIHLLAGPVLMQRALKAAGEAGMREEPDRGRAGEGGARTANAGARA